MGITRVSPKLIFQLCSLSMVHAEQNTSLRARYRVLVLTCLFRFLGRTRIMGILLDVGVGPTDLGRMAVDGMTVTLGEECAAKATLDGPMFFQHQYCTVPT